MIYEIKHTKEGISACFSVVIAASKIPVTGHVDP